MARKGRVDRGLLSKTDSVGKTVWYVRLYHEGKERRFGSFKSKTQAREFYEERKKEQREGRFFPERFQHGGYELVQEAIDRYRQHTQFKKTPKDQRFFGDWWGKQFAGQRLNAITVDRLEAIQHELLAGNRTPQRVNRYFSWLRACLNLAIKKKKLTTNPVCQLTTFPESEGKLRALDMKEEAKLFEAIGPLYAPWVRLAILTGLRQKEQFSLQWANIDLANGIMTLPSTKAGKVQYAPLNDEAQTILRGFNSWQQSKWVFPSQQMGSHIQPLNFYHRHYLPAVKKAGLEGVTWHTLRHTFASRLAMSSVPLGTIAALLRHSGTALVKRYAHLHPEYLRKEIEQVSAFGKPGNSDGTVTETVKTVAGNQVECV